MKEHLSAEFLLKPEEHWAARRTLSGMAPDYGEGGYELTISDSPAASNGELWIQLLDQANLPLSEKIYFQTFDSCDSNLVMINFVQISAE